MTGRCQQAGLSFSYFSGSFRASSHSGAFPTAQALFLHCLTREGQKQRKDTLYATGPTPVLWASNVQHRVTQVTETAPATGYRLALCLKPVQMDAGGRDGETWPREAILGLFTPVHCQSSREGDTGSGQGGHQRHERMHTALVETPPYIKMGQFLPQNYWPVRSNTLLLSRIQATCPPVHLHLGKQQSDFCQKGGHQTHLPDSGEPQPQRESSRQRTRYTHGP